MHSWQIQEAKQHFSEVIRLAKKEGPQRITYRGEESAWIISAEDYSVLKKKKKKKHNLLNLFQNSPHREIDLAIERRKDRPRKIDL